MRLKSKFLLSATSRDQFPPATEPEFAFLGRSNVGKSSLINCLVGEKIARTSATPGRTRSINFFALMDSSSERHPRMLLADLPGYGYAKVSKSISASWPGFIHPYLEERANLRLCICLVDSNLPAQPNDRQLIDLLKTLRRRFFVVGTKADRLSGNGRTRAAALLKRGLGVEELLLCSAKTGAGMKELWSCLAASASGQEAPATGPE